MPDRERLISREASGSIALTTRRLQWCNSFAVALRDEKKKGASLDAPIFFSILCSQADYTQVITPLVMSQTFADCECVAVALHEGGGPATFTATIVTFCDGVNP